MKEMQWCVFGCCLLSSSHTCVLMLWSLFYLTHNPLHTLKAYQIFAEQQRVPPVMCHRPGDEVLHMLQLATKVYSPLQLVLQMLLETAGDILWSSKEPHVKSPRAETESNTHLLSCNIKHRWRCDILRAPSTCMGLERKDKEKPRRRKRRRR